MDRSRSPAFLLRKLAYLIQREERLTRDLEVTPRVVDEILEEINDVLGPEVVGALVRGRLVADEIIHI